MTITTSSLNTEPPSQTVTTTQTITNPDNAAAFTSDFAKQLAQEEEDQRLSAVHQQISRIRPFTSDERNWFKSMYNTVGDYADEQETSMNRTPQNAGSPVMNNQGIQYVPSCFPN